ncbi:MAG: DNA-directed RNA polymerase subunit H [Candidatus Aenigmarchaeota archaeon]|nr:DNA-directed RNA polymerase subunit H [Candidatus Aenigmarchaeota archaeon]
MKEIDIRKHEVVPKHTLLNEKEKEELLKRYNITLKQLPRILASDPVIKLLNGQPGDVVMIERKSLTAGQADYFRVVIKG